MNKHTIIGMAGHIDHGKTALIRALTGIETDRLKEERERGITIDIGFAYWLDNVTIIDVPGHEKFVRNMVAGVSTVDLFLLVIAADDGVMPQTREHLDILKFFGVRSGIVALNKIDLVDEEWLSLVEEDIRILMEDNGFMNVPIIPVSAVSKQGIDRLEAELKSAIARTERPENDRPFRMPVDRSFLSKGFGRIVTGTVLSSRVAVGDTLQILPAGDECKVRGVQVHQKSVAEASAGQRAAINLSGGEKSKPERGSVLVPPGSMDTCRELLAVIHTTAQLPYRIKRHQSAHVHLGTAEYLAKMTWYEKDSAMDPNQTYHIRVLFDEEAVAAPGDPILIRSFSPVTTIAGGRVLEINPPRLKKNEPDWAEYCRILEGDSLDDTLRLLFDHFGYRSVTTGDICRKLFQSEDRIQSLLTKMVRQKTVHRFEYQDALHFIDAKKLEEAVGIIRQKMEQELNRQKAKRGLNFGELFNILKPYRVSEPFLQRALAYGVNKGLLFKENEYYSHRDMAAAGERARLQNEVEQIYLQNRFSPPDLDTVAAQLEKDVKDIKTIALDLARQEVLQSIGGKYYLHRQVINDLFEFLRRHFSENERIEIAAIKSFVDSTRKYVIPLLEFLDNKGYTIRQGDARIKGNRL